MMNNTKSLSALRPSLKPMEKLLRQDGLQSTVDSAFQRYRNKSYLESRKRQADFFRLLSICCHLLSVIFAFGFLLAACHQIITGSPLSHSRLENLFSGDLGGLWLPAILSFVFLGVVELGKAMSVKLLAYTAFKEKRFHIGNAFLVFALMCASVFLSVKGAGEWLKSVALPHRSQTCNLFVSSFCLEWMRIKHKFKWS